MIIKSNRISLKPKESKKLNDFIGRSFSVLTKIRLKGVKSKKIKIEEVSPNLRPYITEIETAYGHIELRPKGIVIRVNKGLQQLIWAIPYYQLYVYKTPGLNIHAQGRYILFEHNSKTKETLPIEEKMMLQKRNFDANHPPIESIEQ